MTVLWQSLAQLALGLGLTLIPFFVGALIGARRLEEAHARAEHFEEKYLDLLDLVQRQHTARPALPSQRSLSEPGLRIVRGGR